jgi:hypothetical protein
MVHPSGGECPSAALSEVTTIFLWELPALAGADKMVETRSAVEDIWGERKPYKHVWPDRVDQFTIEDPEKWVQSACVMCRLFGSCLHNEILLIYFAAMGVD